MCVPRVKMNVVCVFCDTYRCMLPVVRGHVLQPDSVMLVFQESL